MTVYAVRLALAFMHEPGSFGPNDAILYKCVDLPFVPTVGLTLDETRSREYTDGYLLSEVAYNMDTGIFECWIKTIYLGRYADVEIEERAKFYERIGWKRDKSCG